MQRETELPEGVRPRWLFPIVVIVSGWILPALASEALRALVPLALLWMSRHWLDRWARIAMASGSAAHVALFGMLAFPQPFVGDADPVSSLDTAILVARLVELPWMILYVRCGYREPAPTDAR